jgi:hypothetical protein
MHDDGATPWATRAMAWGVGTFSGMVPIYILDLALVAAPIYFLPKMSKGPTSPKQACGHRGCAKRTSSPWLRPVACTATTSSPLASLSYSARRLPDPLMCCRLQLPAPRDLSTVGWRYVLVHLAAIHQCFLQVRQIDVVIPIAHHFREIALPPQSYEKTNKYKAM